MKLRGLPFSDPHPFSEPPYFLHYPNYVEVKAVLNGRGSKITKSNHFGQFKDPPIATSGLLSLNPDSANRGGIVLIRGGIVLPQRLRPMLLLRLPNCCLCRFITASSDCPTITLLVEFTNL